jgi:hypothetical protein
VPVLVDDGGPTWGGSAEIVIVYEENESSEKWLREELALTLKL